MIDTNAIVQAVAWSEQMNPGGLEAVARVASVAIAGIVILFILMLVCLIGAAFEKGPNDN